MTLHAKSKLGRIPVLRFPGESTDARVAAVEAMLRADRDLRAFVEDRHGIFSFAGTIELARYHAELVEETAHIAWSLALSEHVAANRGRDV